MRFPTGKTFVRATAFAAALGLVFALTALPASAVTGSISVLPTSGTPGQAGIVITGTGTNFLSPVVTTMIGTQAASFVINSATRVTATVPCTATLGVGTISVNDGGGAVSTPFTVNTPTAPSGITVVPTIGPIGTFLKIAGANFTCASAVTVGAGNTAATGVSVVSAGEIGPPCSLVPRPVR